MVVKIDTIITAAGCLVVAGLTTYFFFPETAGVPVENTHTVFRDHWFWSRVYPEIKEASLPGTGTGCMSGLGWVLGLNTEDARVSAYWGF